MATVKLKSKLPDAVSPNNGVVFPGTRVRVAYSTRKVPRVNLNIGIKLARVDPAGHVRQIVSRDVKGIESRRGELAVRFPPKELGRFTLAVFTVAARPESFVVSERLMTRSFHPLMARRRAICSPTAAVARPYGGRFPWQPHHPDATGRRRPRHDRRRTCAGSA